MAPHANLTESKIILPKYVNLAAVLIDQTQYIKVNSTNYPSGELADVYNGYTSGPLTRGSQIFTLDDVTQLSHEVESELSANDEDGHFHVKFPRYFFTKLSGDSGTDAIMDVVDASPFSADEYVCIRDDDGNIEFNQILSIDADEITYYNNFSQDWTIAKNSYIGYGVRHHYAGDTGSDQTDKDNVYDANHIMALHLNVDKVPDGASGDTTSNNNDVTINGASDATGKIDRGLAFATNDYLNIADNPSLTVTTVATIEIWVNFSSREGATSRMGFFSKGVNAPFFGIYDESHATKANKVTFGKNAVDEVLSLTTLGNTGVDYHIVGIRRGGSDYIYINGVEDASAVLVDFEATGDDLIIGADQGLQSFLAGTLDEVTYSDVARSADWVLARYNSGLGTGVVFGAAVSVAAGNPWYHNAQQ